MEGMMKEEAMLDLLVEYRHAIAVAVMGAGFLGLFVGQEVARQRHLSRMARDCREATRRKG